jgi:catechol 2,3-dioxygenase-like lactoylglutathione lyase family enzyme
MSADRTIFNHVGLCVRERDRSRRFYEGLLGFTFWWEIDPPDEGTDQLLGLPAPLGLHATYLLRDGLVLELLDYSGREVRSDGQREMDQVGLTHMSFSVADLGATLQRVAEYGGEVVPGSASDYAVMIRDPDGQLIELLADEWLSQLPPRPE